MGRLIDADKLKAAVERHEVALSSFLCNDYDNGFNSGIECAVIEVEDAEPVEAIPFDWIEEYLAWLKDIGAFALPDANAIKSMLKKWEMEQGHSGCGPDYCNI